MELIRVFRRQGGTPVLANPGGKFLLLLFFPALLFFNSRALLFSQNTGALNEAEGRSFQSTPLTLQKINTETILNSPVSENSPAAKQEALIRLAWLQQLSGDIEAASKNWLLAASIEQGVQNDCSLVAGAYCLAVMGEWEKACQTIAPLLRADKQGQANNRAHYLDAFYRASIQGDAANLISMANNSTYGELRSLIYYTLWKLAGERKGITGAGDSNEWKTRLLAEFPQSPESLIVLEETLNTPSAASASSRVINSSPNPLWLFLPGFEGWQKDEISSGSPVTQPSPSAQSQPPVVQPSPAAVQQPASTRYLQTGLFSNEANARRQANTLGDRGFPAVVNTRIVNGNEFWSVTVPAGQDMNRTIQDLKKAGFDSFPL